MKDRLIFPELFDTALLLNNCFWFESSSITCPCALSSFESFKSDTTNSKLILSPSSYFSLSVLIKAFIWSKSGVFWLTTWYSINLNAFWYSASNNSTLTLYFPKVVLSFVPIFSICLPFLSVCLLYDTVLPKGSCKVYLIFLLAKYSFVSSFFSSTLIWTTSFLLTVVFGDVILMFAFWFVFNSTLGSTILSSILIFCFANIVLILLKSFWFIKFTTLPSSSNTSIFIPWVNDNLEFLISLSVSMKLVDINLLRFFSCKFFLSFSDVILTKLYVSCDLFAKSSNLALLLSNNTMLGFFKSTTSLRSFDLSFRSLTE